MTWLWMALLTIGGLGLDYWAKAKGSREQADALEALLKGKQGVADAHTKAQKMMLDWYTQHIPEFQKHYEEAVADQRAFQQSMMERQIQAEKQQTVLQGLVGQINKEPGVGQVVTNLPQASPPVFQPIHTGTVPLDPMLPITSLAQ